MSITNPTQLVDEFKKSGEFDRLRRELLAEFQQSDGITAFKTRVDEIARKHYSSDRKRMEYMSQEALQRELSQEVQRYPVVERALADVRMLSDPSFAAGIRSSAQKILREDRTGKSKPKPQNGKNKGTKSQPNGHSTSTDPPAASNRDQSGTPAQSLAVATADATSNPRPVTPSGEIQPIHRPASSTSASVEASAPPEEVVDTEKMVTDVPSQRTAPDNKAVEPLTETPLMTTPLGTSTSAEEPGDKVNGDG